MNIVLGASGQVGSAIVDHLIQAKEPVKGIVRTEEKAEELKKKGALAAVADAFDLPALQAAFQDGSTVFVLTPETGNSQDVIGDTQRILANYRAVIEASSIKKVVGLSSMGAQCAVNSGNLEMSYLLEHAFLGLDITQIFIRPAYYYSNWMPYVPGAKDTGVLPTFYPIDQNIPMTSPLDVAELVADVMIKPIEGSAIYEIEGPDCYSSSDVADVLGDILGRKVIAQQTPEDKWNEQLEKIGFTEDAVKNFIAMTKLVISGDAVPERKGVVSVKAKTSLTQYLANDPPPAPPQREEE